MSLRVNRGVFWCEEGFSTAGMAVALLVTLSLIFACARVYEIQSASAQVQEVADASALAAENVVGEFYIVATVCDALVLTLSLTSVAAVGLGVVCACVPPAAPAAKSFFDAAVKIKEARDSFCEKAQASLDKLAQALPFIATVKAQEVMGENSDTSASYQGIVVLAPWEAESSESLDFETADDALDSSQNSSEELQEAAQEAEEAAEEANRWKQHAYEHDSGSKSSYCMYERAAKLAGMQGSSNPFFSSIDTWSFSAALARAQAYYPMRYEKEAPTGTSAEAQGDSALRKRFYAYAAQVVSKGYVHESADSFDASFPLLPKNTDEMRATELYTEAVYPVTQDATGALSMHAWSGCPGMEQASQVGVGAIRDMDGAVGYVTCSSCEFSVSSMGKVAAASTNISNGFEYHYNEVARAAAEYQKARSLLDPLTAQVKELAGGLLDKVKAALSEAFSARIEVLPPGHKGAIALVVDTSSPASAFSSSFMGTSDTLGQRAAVSSAALVKESSDEGANVITSFLDGYTQPSSAFDVVLELWSGLLGVYTQGHEALASAIRTSLDGLPLMSASGVGTWASAAFEEVVESIGFEPPDLRARKAVLVNSAHVLEQDSSAFSARLLSVKQAASSGGFDGALSAVQHSAASALGSLSSQFEIATIVLVEGVVEIPVTIALPASITRGIASAVQGGIDYLRGLSVAITGVRQWR